MGASRAFPLAVGLNLAFVVVEFGYGFWANSTALMADAGHNLSDVLGLLLAWGAAVLSRRQPGGRYTYGLRSTSILAALANAMLLLVASGAIALEAMQRLFAPAEVAGLAVTLVALVGIAVNGFSAWLFMAGSRHDLNQRAAWLHLLGDAAVSLAVVIGGLIILKTGWQVVDPILSLLIVAIIMLSTWGLLREAFRLSVNAVPAHIDLQAVQEFLLAQPEVSEVHDLHIWAMSTTESALTVSLVVREAQHDDALLDRLQQQLQESFRIGHSTIQLRRLAPPKACSLE
jgi:cobalt-zinc-cadmium efflux system protein